MSEDSPLGNIREQLEESGRQQNKDTKGEQVPQEPEEEEGPSFPFAEAKQSPLYPHRDRWVELEDAKFEMEMVLREHGVRDVQGRELDDAILRYAIADPEAVAELVLEARGVEEP